MKKKMTSRILRIINKTIILMQMRTIVGRTPQIIKARWKHFSRKCSYKPMRMTISNKSIMWLLFRISRETIGSSKTWRTKTMTILKFNSPSTMTTTPVPSAKAYLEGIQGVTPTTHEKATYSSAASVQAPSKQWLNRSSHLIQMNWQPPRRRYQVEL